MEAPPPAADGSSVVLLSQHLRWPSKLVELTAKLDGETVFVTKDAAQHPPPRTLMRQLLSPGAHTLELDVRIAASCGVSGDKHQVIHGHARQSLTVGSTSAAVLVDLVTRDPWGAPEDRLAVEIDIARATDSSVTYDAEVERDDCGPEVDDVPPWKADPNPRILPAVSFALVPK